MFHLSLNFKINEKILFKSNILLHLYNTHIQVICIHIFLRRNAIFNASSYRNGRIIFIVERMICYFEYRKFAKRKLTSRGRISRVATRYRPISKFSWIPNGQQEIRLEMLADMLTELHFKQLPFFSWNYEYFHFYQMLLSWVYCVEFG